mmetsp:Transcript_89020/g.186009  ORF Transcript_89020/g.186009 Transcript_89020/m.186009 type:complete len:256 (+) Transcript_89020:504-1271(+)
MVPRANTWIWWTNSPAWQKRVDRWLWQSPSRQRGGLGPKRTADISGVEKSHGPMVSCRTTSIIGTTMRSGKSAVTSRLRMLPNTAWGGCFFSMCGRFCTSHLRCFVWTLPLSSPSYQLRLIWCDSSPTRGSLSSQQTTLGSTTLPCSSWRSPSCDGTGTVPSPARAPQPRNGRQPPARRMEGTLLQQAFRRAATSSSRLRLLRRTYLPLPDWSSGATSSGCPRASSLRWWLMGGLSFMNQLMSTLTPSLTEPWLW